MTSCTIKHAVGGFSKDNEMPLTTAPADLETELTNNRVEN